MRPFPAALFPAVLLLAALGCARKPPVTSVAVRAHNQKLAQAGAILARGGKLAEGSFYACMLNGYMQGLPLHQVSDECATKLMEDDSKGFGGPLGDIGHQEMFDPSKVLLACHAGDPTVGQTSGWVPMPGYGGYSYGGDKNHYYQYVKEDSKRLKEEAVQKWEEAVDKFSELAYKEEQAKKALDEAKKTGNQQAIADAQKAYDDALKAAKEQARKAQNLFDDAQADPNKKPPSDTRPGDESPCDQALEAARTVLRECTRTDWKDPRCERLQARLNNCPDPTLIYVDPEQGYACGAKPDPEAVKNAWVKRCQEKVLYGPDTPNPCAPPTIDGSGHYGNGPIGDVCNDPHAYLNPDSNDCAGTFTLTGVSQPTVTEIAVWGMNRIGGPLIVFPPRTPGPHRGPDPTPPPP